jgi:hypothetical protein
MVILVFMGEYLVWRRCAVLLFLPCAHGAVWPGAGRRYNNCWWCGYLLRINLSFSDRHYASSLYVWQIPFFFAIYMNSE